MATFKQKKDAAAPLSASQLLTERIKTVVRRLPPNLPADVFWRSVQQWVNPHTVSWSMFYPGKIRKRMNNENISSRAYIAFRTEEQLAQFSKEYDGHVFRDKAGNESQAIVEFAPYQKVPSERKRLDARNATIEKDEDYISFLATLEASENVEPHSLESLIAAAQSPPPPKTTPLLEALKVEKSAMKDKEAILRNHAHYIAPSAVLRREKGTSGAGPSHSQKASEIAAQGNAGSSKGKGDFSQKVGNGVSMAKKSSTEGTANQKGGKGMATGAMVRKKAAKRAAGASASVGAFANQNQSQGRKAPTGKSNGPDDNSIPVNVVQVPARIPKPPRAPRRMKPTIEHKSVSALAQGDPNGKQPDVNGPTILTNNRIDDVDTQKPTGPTVDTTSRPKTSETAELVQGQRMRPVIGLASRHFEAAMNSVGGGKGRRQDCSRDTHVASNAAVALVAVEANNTALAGHPTMAETPGSPKGDRTRRGDERVPSVLVHPGDATGTPGAETSNGPGPLQMPRLGRGGGRRGGRGAPNAIVGGGRK